MDGEADDLEILQGTLDLIVLRALEDGELHGYGVMAWIRTRMGEEIRLNDAALYPALRRLEARGLIDSTWGRSENNRRARFYTITDAGRARLRARSRAWFRYADALSRILPEAPGDAGA